MDRQAENQDSSGMTGTLREMLALQLVILVSQGISDARFGFPQMWGLELDNTDTTKKLTSWQGNEKIVVSMEGNDDPKVTYSIRGRESKLGDEKFPMDKLRAWMQDLSMFIEGL